MKLIDLLESPPLPDDWDHGMYDQRVPFKHRVEYAKARASQLGVGSSRVTFEIPYQGRPTALKIAMNRKGMAQMALEAEILDDGYAQMLDIVIPIIDYDEKNASPTWIHMEKAERIGSEQQLARLLGVQTMLEFIWFLQSANGPSKLPQDITDEMYENPITSAAFDIVSNFGVSAGDLYQKANWGIYKGKPVIIDLGLNDDIWRTYYKK